MFKNIKMFTNIKMFNLIKLTGCNLRRAGNTSPNPSRAPPKIYYFFLFTKNILDIINRATKNILIIINRVINKAFIIKFTSEQQSEDNSYFILQM